MSCLSHSLRIVSFACALAIFGATGAQAQSEPAPPPEEKDKASSPPESAQQPAPPQEWWRELTFGTTLESYYQFNFNEPAGRANLLRAYDASANSFSVGQAAVIVEVAPNVDAGRRFGMRLDLQFGQATEAASGNPLNEPRPDAFRNVWQAYGTYIFPVGRGLTVDIGKFSANLGFETNYAKDNQAFSRAFLFNFLPYYHTGVRTTLPLSDKASVSYMLTNGIGQAEEFNNFKSQQVSVTVKPTAAVSITGNFYSGQEQADGGLPDGPDGRFQILDAYIAYTATSALTLGLDVNRSSNEVNQVDDELSATGVGAYARYQLTPAAALGLRFEHVDDEGLFSGVDQSLKDLTLTAEYKLADGFVVRGEFRRDWSNEDFFPAPTSDRLKSHQNTVLAGLVWWFGNKQGVW